jgi:hypothetical protein
LVGKGAKRRQSLSEGECASVLAVPCDSQLVAIIVTPNKNAPAIASSHHSFEPAAFAAGKKREVKVRALG